MTTNDPAEDEPTMTTEPASPTNPEVAHGEDPAPTKPAQPAFDEQPFLDATSDAKSRYGRFNLAIIGKSGVGKSSLVNAVFGRDLAKVGKGLPVTRGANYYHDDSLGIWDLEGFELGTKHPADLLRENLETIAARPPIEQISVVWYCVNSHADRLEQPEIDVIRDLDARGIPVIVVLTKAAWDKNPITGKRTLPLDTVQFCEWLDEPFDEVADVKVPIEVPFRRYLLTATRDRQGKAKGYGLGELVAETLALSPEDEKDAFRIAQRLNLPWKRELARPVIVAAAGAAAATAVVPLPVANAVALAPIQLAMMGRIATIYDLELKAMLSASGLAQLAAQITGQSLARGALALIPGAGSAVNASVAGALTAAMGEGWLRLCEQVHTGKVDLAKAAEELGAYVPGFLDIIRKMAEQKIAKP